MTPEREAQRGQDADLVRRLGEFERAPARERKDGVTITEQDAGRVKELVQRELEKDFRRTQRMR